MTFEPGLMNRAMSNREMFRQVQTMPVTAYDPRLRRSEELMEYVSEGTEGQWKDPEKQVLGVLSDEDLRKAEKRNPGSTTKGKRPRISMGTGSSSQAKAASTRRSAKSLAPKSPGEQTETGRQIEGALSGIGQGLAALFSEKPAAPQQERPVLPMDYVKEGTHGQPFGWPGGSSDDEETDPWVRKAYKQHAKDRVAWRRRTGDIPSDEQVPPPYPDPGESIRKQKYVEKGTHGQDWDLIRLGMDAQEQDWHGKSKGKPQKPAAGDSTWREWASERSKGSREHFDTGHT